VHGHVLSVNTNHSDVFGFPYAKNREVGEEVLSKMNAKHLFYLATWPWCYITDRNVFVW